MKRIARLLGRLPGRSCWWVPLGDNASLSFMLGGPQGLFKAPVYARSLRADVLWTVTVTWRSSTYGTARRNLCPSSDE